MKKIFTCKNFASICGKTDFKEGFTLAEVLITLGIIGVVSSMTIPTLMTNIKAHRLRTQFLKSYSLVQQAFKQMEEAGDSIDSSSYLGKEMSKVFVKHFKGVTFCEIPEKNPNCYDYRNTSSKPRYKTIDGRDILGFVFDDGQFYTNDGTLFLFNCENPGNYNKWLSIDINGYNNPPNRWGVDLFTLKFMDGELRTMGDIQTTRFNNLKRYCNLQSKEILNGIACAHRAKTETDYFKWVVKNIK